MLVYILIIIAIVLGLYHCSIHYSRHGRLLNKLNGPPVFPVIGNIQFLGNSSNEIWNTARWLGREYYPVNRIWLAHYSAVNIFNPYDAEILLSSMKHIEKSHLYEFLHPWLKSGLLTSTGKKWQNRRKILTPAFHFSVLHQFLEIFMEQGNNLVHYLKSQGNESEQNLVHFFTKYTLNTICETAMGTSLLETKIDNTYRDALGNVIKQLVYRLTRPWLYPTSIFKLFPSGRHFMKSLSILHTFSSKIIKERKDFHEQTGDEHLKSIMSVESQLISDDDGIKSRKKRMAMLDHLIAAQKFAGQIDDDGIREEVDTFIFEGHDTTAMAMCFTVLMLAEHKEIQDRARKEVDEVFNGKNGKIHMTEIQRLNYLEQCIKETLRLYPSVPFVSRKLTEDLQLTDHLVPAGSSAHLHIYDIHRDLNFWPKPDKYDPDRFLPEKMQIRHPFSYIPFSGGPRNCIGQKFAMLELKALMAHLLHNFTFEPIDNSRDIIFTADLVLRPATPIRVKFVTRR